MKGIKHFPSYFGGLSAIGLALATPNAVAQELHNHDLCRQTSTYPPEQLGDHDGHILNYGSDSCETVEGVTKGAVWTTYIMWEWDGPKAKELAGWAVGRKVGATQTCQDIPEKGNKRTHYNRWQGDGLDGLRAMCGYDGDRGFCVDGR